ncbi:penicillin-binding transpeptidase domain-containing protein [Vagococcus fluvialis]|uniref:penicillin-binding protein PBP4(5) n=1 Tax=Vagococcus fluvialis TaxID=2738 RepID=UPI002033D4F1|nr:penicillin-binding transpeptidase domain-containing protein [Vagococcus fluvialis]MCM2137750.1 penicillin-binding transpeptidase domain-containing protein [Vagococcus fluvialis]
MENKRSRKRKKNNKPLYITIGAASLVVISAGSFFGYQHYQKSQKEKVIKEFVAQFEKKDFKKLVSTLDESSIKQNELTKETAIEKYETIFNNLNLIKIDGTVTDINKDHFKLKFNMTSSFGEIKDINYEGDIIKNKKGDYAIDWNYSLIFPEMEKGDKVFINHYSPKRGQILDKNNQPLATETNYLQYGIVPKELGEGEARETRVKQVSEKLDTTVESIKSQLEQSWVTEELFVPLKTLPSDQVVTEMEALNIHHKEISKRYYPLKEAAAQLIGYTGTVTAEELEKDPELSGFETTGKTGLEAQLDKELRGKIGVRVDIVDENNEVRKAIIDENVTDGKDVHLTIDSNIQKQAFDSLDNLPGATVVTAPKTGELTAVVSSPSYDPNEFILGMSQKKYDEYAKDPLNPFLARFAVGFAPGSTFKAITAAIGIDAKVTTPDKTHDISGLKWQKDGSWGDYFVTRVSDTVSQVNMTDALVYSDNIYFSKEALEMGEKTYLSGLEKFPFGEKMNVHIPMTPAQISNDGIKSEILLADTSYGQGQLLINPIQQAIMYSVFPNKGNLVMPKIIQEEESKTQKDIISENAANLVTNALIQTVENANGTAHVLSNGTTIAAKTGTAEIKEKQDTKGKENSFILAYEPTEGRYLIVSMIEGADGTSAVEKNKTLINSL